MSSNKQSQSVAFAAGKHQSSLGRRKLSRQKYESDGHPEGIVSLKLSQNGLLRQEGTDVEIEVTPGRIISVIFGLVILLSFSTGKDKGTRTTCKAQPRLLSILCEICRIKETFQYLH